MPTIGQQRTMPSTVPWRIITRSLPSSLLKKKKKKAKWFAEEGKKTIKPSIE